MKTWRSLLGLAGLFALLLGGCEETSESPGEFDTAYFPMVIGNYIIYDLDSIVYDDFNMVVNQRTMQVRETVESSFTDASGNESYRIFREYRDNETEAWGADGFDVWFGNYDGNKAERVEENQRYVKLVFPVRLGKTWDGNIHINIDPSGPLGYLDGWEYRISELDAPRTVNGQTFDSTLTVIQQESGTAIDTVGAREMYAKGIGMIFRELWVLESQCTSCDPDDTPCIIACQAKPWAEKAEKGFIVIHRIKSYGQL